MQNNKYTPLLLLLLIALLFSLFTVYIYGNGDLNVSARSAVLYAPDSKQFVFEKNAYERLPMASTTKILTALIAIESCDMSETVSIPREAVGIEGSSVYLKEGDELTVKDLVYSLLLQSANDAAAALAYKIGGDIRSFANIMNTRAEALGLTDTHFDNPHGLDSEEHYTTAHDLAIIAAEALDNDTFRNICSTYKYSFTIGDSPRVVVNHNKLLKSYDGAIGVKTGYTKRCGRCLVGAAERDGLRLISVTLDAPDDWSDHKRLLDYGFDTLEAVSTLDLVDIEFTVAVVSGKSETALARLLVPEGDGVIVKKRDEDIRVEVDCPRYIAAPAEKGEKIGKVKIYSLDKLIKEYDIALTDRIAKKKSFLLF